MVVAAHCSGLFLEVSEGDADLLAEIIGSFAGDGSGVFEFLSSVTESEKGFCELIVLGGWSQGGDGGASGNGSNLKFENFFFQLKYDALGKSGADSGGDGEGFGVLRDDCFDGAAFGEGADEGEGDFCATAFDFAEHFEESSLAGIAEPVEGVFGFSNDEAGVEIDSFVNDAVFDEDGMGDMNFVSDTVAIDNNWAGIGFEHFSS